MSEVGNIIHPQILLKKPLEFGPFGRFKQENREIRVYSDYQLEQLKKLIIFNYDSKAMRLNMRTLINETFSIEVDPEDTILNVKRKIQEHKQVKTEHQKIYVKGKIVSNQTTIRGLDLAEGQFVVLYDTNQSSVGLPRKENITFTSSLKPNQNLIEEETFQIEEKLGEKRIVGEEKKELNVEQKIKEIMLMGFQRQMSLNALQSTNFDLQKASDMLIQDLSIEEEERGKNFSQSEEHLRTKLMQIKSFAEIREMIRKDKALKNVILKQFFGTSPKLHQMILKYPETFEKIIMEDYPNPKMTFSLEEKKFIKKMIELGYDKKNVIKAYLVCERDQAEALNYLLKKNDRINYKNHIDHQYYEVGNGGRNEMGDRQEVDESMNGRI